MSHCPKQVFLRYSRSFFYSHTVRLSDVSLNKRQRQSYPILSNPANIGKNWKAQATRPRSRPQASGTPWPAMQTACSKPSSAPVLYLQKRDEPVVSAPLQATAASALSPLGRVDSPMSALSQAMSASCDFLLGRVDSPMNGLPQAVFAFLEGRACVPGGYPVTPLPYQRPASHTPVRAPAR